MLVAVFLGPEFPSLLGALIGLALVMLAARRGLFMPRTPWDFSPPSEWEANWMGSLRPETTPIAERMSLVRAWMPYILVAALLVLTPCRSCRSRTCSPAFR